MLNDTVHLPDATRRWAEDSLGTSIAEVRPLTGGWTSRMSVLTTSAGQRLVLREITREPWRRHGEELIGREARVQRELAATGIPVPQPIAVDARAEYAVDPALLMTLLPGRLELERADDVVLEALAGVMNAIHAYHPPELPRSYQTWGQRVVPEWTERPELWREAFAELEEEPPAYEPVFIHRDFHLGNVLWEGTTVTGVVDWVETSSGPAQLDIAHCRANLAMLHGPEAARRFGELAEPGRYWDLLDIAGYLPDPVKVVAPWRDQGRPISDDLARARLEDYLADVLS